MWAIKDIKNDKKKSDSYLTNSARLN